MSSITKQGIIDEINKLEMMKFKLIGKLELLDEQEKEVKTCVTNNIIDDVKENAESTGL